jgi:hypothetical protein
MGVTVWIKIFWTRAVTELVPSLKLGTGLARHALITPTPTSESDRFINDMGLLFCTHHLRLKRRSSSENCVRE